MVTLGLLLGAVQASSQPQSQAADHYRRGVALLERRLWDAALLEFDEVLKLDPDQAETHIARGIALSNKGELERALEVFGRAVALLPNSAEARYNLGLALRNAGRTAEAVSALEKALRLDPAHEPSRLELGMLLQRLGEWDRSIKQFQAILERNPESAAARNWLGVAFQERREFKAAIAEFRHAVELDPALVQAHNSLGTLLAETGELTLAVEAFRTASGLAPRDLEIRMNLGVALRTAGRAGEAAEHFRFVLANVADPGATALRRTSLPEVHYQLAQALRQDRDLEGAVAAYEKALNLNPELSEAYYSLGQTLKRQAARVRAPAAPRQEVPPAARERFEAARAAVGRGDIGAALADLEQAVTAVPDFAKALDLLGFLQGRQGDLANAQRNLRRAVELAPDSADMRYHLALALWYEGSRTEATAELEETLRRDPAHAEACAFLGLAYREEGRVDDALRFLQRAIALDRERPGAYVDLGVVLLRAGRGDWALGQFQAALNLPASAGAIPDPDVAVAALRAELATGREHPVAYNVLGRLQGKSGAPSHEVAAAFRNAIRLQPDYAEAHNNLGLVLTQTGDTGGAVAAFREALRLQPDYAEARANLGGVLVVVNTEEAIEQLTQALDQQPNLAKARYNLSQAYNRLDDRAREIEALQQALAADPGFAKAHYALGKALLAQRHTAQAISHFETALALDPSLGEARYQLGLALVRAGRREEGQRELEASRPLIAEKQKAETATVFMREAQQALDGGQFDSALDKLRQVVRLVPLHAEAHVSLGEALAARGDIEPAAESFARAVELEPDMYRAFLGLGQARSAQAATEVAAEAFRSAATLRPSSAEAQRLLGKALEKVGDEHGALEAYSKAASLQPEDADSRRAADRILAKQRERRRLEMFEALAETRPTRLAGVDLAPTGHDDAELVRDLASAIRQGRYRAVEPRLRAYVRERPESWWGLYALGYALFAQQKLGEAVQALTKSLRLNLENAEAHKILGRILMIIGRYDRALIEFQQAKRYKPGSAEIRYNLGKVYSAQDDFPAARQAFDEALQLDAEYMEAYNALGFALESMSRDAEAVENYLKAIELSERNGAAFVAPYVNLAAYHNRLNQPAEALKYAARALDIDPRSDLAMFQVAKAHRAEKRWPEAAEALEQATAINARVSRYHYVLGLVYRHLGQNERSREALERFRSLEREALELEAKRRATSGGAD